MSGNIYKTPLTPAVFHILLALSTQARHGYGIMKQVEANSEKGVKMGPGTLYGSISRMIEGGLVRECEPPKNSEDDSRRIYYTLTDLGHTVLRDELTRYEKIVTLAKEIQLLPNNFAYDF